MNYDWSQLTARLRANLTVGTAQGVCLYRKISFLLTLNNVKINVHIRGLQQLSYQVNDSSLGTRKFGSALSLYISLLIYLLVLHIVHSFISSFINTYPKVTRFTLHVIK